MNNNDLSDFFITKSQAADFRDRLTSVIERMYSADFNAEKILGEEFGVGRRDKLIRLMYEKKVINLKTFFQSIIDDIDNLSVIYLSLAIEPGESILKAISLWFVINTGKQILIDYKIERDLIAGAAINYQGKFKDYSIKPVFDEMVMRKITNPNSNQINQPFHQKTEHMTIGR
jgi:F0F1-type ATP synthase delta subunit